jgi:hypothetical protein
MFGLDYDVVARVRGYRIAERCTFSVRQPTLFNQGRQVRSPAGRKIRKILFR